MGSKFTSLNQGLPLVLQVSPLEMFFQVLVLVEEEDFSCFTESE